MTMRRIVMGKTWVLALNMMDVVEGRGMENDLHRIPEILGIPACPDYAR